MSSQNITARVSLTLVLLDYLIPPGLVITIAVFYFRASFSVVFWPLLIFYTLLRIKRILLWLILVYQRFAPKHIRDACALTPSCSEYMILAIEKYGVFAGVAKGASRLKRCKGEEGEDYP
jgi:putative component of membrane protein insertase Oxa1/YidC/SpoIIIJ protein YidD